MECTSVGISIADKIVLAKNRDRTYNPIIKIVREMVGNTEMLYMYDMNTDYSEGMNEHGIGIVNTTLQGKADEKELKATSVQKKLGSDGHIIRTALRFKDINKILEALQLFKRGIGGHTTIAYPEGFIAIEKLNIGKPVIKKYEPKEIIVRTNHGIAYPDQGYQFGTDRDSSLSRAFYANLEARKAQKPHELLELLRRHHGIAGYLEPYRTNYKVWTSSQILMNLTDLEMMFVIDENTRFMGIENNLPIGYSPKIGLRVFKVNTYYKATEVSAIPALVYM